MILCQLPQSFSISRKEGTPVARKVMDYYLLGEIKDHTKQ